MEGIALHKSLPPNPGHAIGAADAREAWRALPSAKGSHPTLVTPSAQSTDLKQNLIHVRLVETIPRRARSLLAQTPPQA